MKFDLIKFPSENFTYNRHSKCLVGEASDMGNRHLQLLYDNACDFGFAVRSEKTGKVVTFVMTSPFYVGEGEDRELIGWHYVPTSESLRAVPECQGMEAKVFND
jgi:hypothetical protein